MQRSLRFAFDRTFAHASNAFFFYLRHRYKTRAKILRVAAIFLVCFGLNILWNFGVTWHTNYQVMVIDFQHNTPLSSSLITHIFFLFSMFADSTFAFGIFFVLFGISYIKNPFWLSGVIQEFFWKKHISAKTVPITYQLAPATLTVHTPEESVTRKWSSFLKVIQQDQYLFFIKHDGQLFSMIMRDELDDLQWRHALHFLGSLKNPPLTKN
jgi:hypothetical protein